MAKTFVNILLLAFFLGYAKGTMKKYANYTLYRSIPGSQYHLEFLKNLRSEIDVDFWKMPGLVNMPVDMLIGPGDKEKFLRSMETNKYSYDTVIEDIQRAIDNQTVKRYIRRKMDSFDWTTYFNLRDIYNWIRDLAKKYPNDVSIIEMGRTYEGRQIYAVKVRFKNAKIRSSVIVEGGIHAREWIAPAVVTYCLNLVINSGKGNIQNAKWRKLALTYEWYFIPVANPDGYDFTFTTDRLWRKNRWEGFGVDVNRNFDIAFGTVGVERDKTSTIYCGIRAFSERESKALANLTRSHQNNLEYYLAFHSYGQYIIIPYAHSKKHLANYDEVKNILLGAKNAIAQRYGTQYKVGTAYDTVGYTTSGVSGCWVKANFDVRYVATFELRDDDNGYSYGFALPDRFILPTCYETMDGLEYILTPKSGKSVKLKPDENVVSFDDSSGRTIFDFNYILLAVNLLLVHYFTF